MNLNLNLLDSFCSLIGKERTEEEKKKVCAAGKLTEARQKVRNSHPEGSSSHSNFGFGYEDAAEIEDFRRQ